MGVQTLGARMDAKPNTHGEGQRTTATRRRQVHERIVA